MKEAQQSQPIQSTPAPAKPGDVDGEHMKANKQPMIKDTPTNRTVKVIKETPFIDRSVKPSLNNFNDYLYQEEQQVC